MSKPVLVIAGPTASGKSGLALAAAQEFGGVVINADSMQIYKELRILTARPTTEDEARAPHRLYGVLPAAELSSAAKWLELAVAEIDAAHRQGLLPIIAGGTGFYLRALMQGLSEMPAIPDDVRAEVRGTQEKLGNEAFHAELAKFDRAAADRLPPGDKQRVARAVEIYMATGRSLTEWQADAPVAPMPEATFLAIVFDPPRGDLNAASNARHDRMMAAGALDEARALGALKLNPALPAMKALGVPELLSFLADEISLDEAVEAAKQSTRQYAKRQQSWFRNQIEPDFRVFAQYSESLNEEIFTIIRKLLLTTQI